MIKHDKDWALELTMDIIRDLGYDVEHPWQYFDGDESLKAVRKFNAFIIHAEHAFDLNSMDMARLMIFLANPTMTTCCDELLEGLEGQGLLD